MRLKGFDPTQTGPLDLFRAFKEWFARNALYLFVAGVALLATRWYLIAKYGFESPDVPTWMWVVALAATAGILLGFYPVLLAINSLWSKDDEPLVELDPDTGDLAVLDLAPDRFENMTVVDHNGKIRSPSYLHEIRLASGRKAVEVDEYYPEENVAVASWMAGATNRDIRRHEKATSWIKRELSREADKSLDALVNAPEIMRAQGSLIANTLIRTVEGVEKPGDDEAGVYERMYEVVEEADVTGQLLEDRGVEDVDEAIKAMSNGDSEDEENDFDMERFSEMISQNSAEEVEAE